MGLKKNICLSISFFFSVVETMKFAKINSQSWKKYLYLVQNSLYSYDNKALKQFESLYLSDLCKTIQYSSNSFHRIIEDIDLDYSISSYNANWEGDSTDTTAYYNTRTLSNEFFMTSSFFITSFDSSIILYPQAFFESNFFSYRFEKILDLNSFFISNSSVIIYLVYNFLINYMQYLYKKIYKVEFEKFINFNFIYFYAYIKIYRKFWSWLKFKFSYLSWFSIDSHLQIFKKYFKYFLNLKSNKKNTSYFLLNSFTVSKPFTQNRSFSNYMFRKLIISFKQSIYKRYRGLLKSKKTFCKNYKNKIKSMATASGKVGLSKKTIRWFLYYYKESVDLLLRIKKNHNICLI